MGKIWKIRENMVKLEKTGKNGKNWKKWEKMGKIGKIIKKYFPIFPLVHFQKESATPREQPNRNDRNLLEQLFHC